MALQKGFRTQQSSPRLRCTWLGFVGFSRNLCTSLNLIRAYVYTRLLGDIICWAFGQRFRSVEIARRWCLVGGISNSSIYPWCHLQIIPSLNFFVKGEQKKTASFCEQIMFREHNRLQIRTYLMNHHPICRLHESLSSECPNHRRRLFPLKKRPNSFGSLGGKVSCCEKGNRKHQ